LRYKGSDIQLKAVLFDLDGTLIDSKQDIAAAANSVRIHFDMPPLPLEVVTGYIGWGIENLNRKTLGLDDPQKLAEGLVILKDYYREHAVDHVVIYPGVWELLDFLKNRGIKLGMVSNKPHDLTLLTLDKLKLSPYFTVVLGADAMVNKKPHPEPLLTVLERLGVSPSEAVMIGDSPVDVEAARAANIPIGLVSHGFVDEVHLQAAQPDWLVHSLLEFKVILL
jgi:phosphoglycolate phosphatase